MTRVEVLALVPARGGSKSIPMKNLVELGGRPLISYSIAVARESRLVDRIIVSTDSPEIAEVAIEQGAEAPFLRPAELAGDLARDIDYHLHALEWLEQHDDYRPDLIVNLRPTHPIRRADTIDEAIAALVANPRFDSLRSVRLAHESPYKMWTRSDDGSLAPIADLDGVHEPYNAPRQSLPMVYWQDGYVDIARRSTILDKRSTTGGPILGFVVEEKETDIDIDYPEDLRHAESLLGLTRDPQSGSPPSDTSWRHPS